ncbi:MAG: MmcQ/YjbR family DNA-binding protein [Solirubrobacterales bacterium]|nr:MmcQ/YjbR family DNA-binding protein [Solirubrobacterales bacterium]
MSTEDDVRELALALPETTEKSSYGTPGFRVKDRLFARIREAGVLVVWCESLEEKEFLLEGDPGKFFTTPHYDGYLNVLVRLEAVDRGELAELLAESVRIRSAD